MDDQILTEEEIQAAVRRIFRLAQTNAGFRDLCLKDPVAAIHEVTGKFLPENYKIEFRDTPHEY